MAPSESMTAAQMESFKNIHEVGGLIDAFAVKVPGTKALKAFYQLLLGKTFEYKESDGFPALPALALVFHKTSARLMLLQPKEIHMELATKENYSLWKVSALSAEKQSEVTRVWGPRGLWGGVTDFQLDVVFCEDLVYLTNPDVEELVDLLDTTRQTLTAKAVKAADALKAKSDAEKVQSTRAEAKKVTSLEAQLLEERALRALREGDYVQMAYDLHVQKFGDDGNFVSPISGVTWQTGRGGSTGSGRPAPLPGTTPIPPPPDPSSEEGSAASSAQSSAPLSPHVPTLSDSAQNQLLDARIREAILRVFTGSAGIPGFPLASMPSAPPFSPTITVNTGTNSELKKQNYKKVMAIKPLFDVAKFSQTWQALDVDATNKTTSFNMEHAADLFRRIITERQGRWAREPSEKFLRNATLFLFNTGADGLMLEHFLGPKEVIGENWTMFEKATVNVTQAYKEYFGDDMKLALLEYFHSLTAIHSQFEGIPVQALTHLAQVTLGKLREVENGPRNSVFYDVSAILRIDRDSPEVSRMMHAESFGLKGKRSGVIPRHPADITGLLDDGDEEEAARLIKKVKARGSGQPGPPPPPTLKYGPPPCYRWVTGHCTGATCPVKPSKRTGPHPHAWNPRDVGTAAQKEFTKFCEKWKDN